MADVLRPPAIRTDTSNAFANNTMRVRIPDIVREVEALNPDYPAPIRAALGALREAVASGAPIPMLDLPAPDYDEWAAAYAEHAGETWHDTQWFFAETYFYRQLMQAVRWWETKRDPFAPRKAAELDSAELWQALELALESRAMPIEQRLSALLVEVLWGNRIDLSFAALAHGRVWTDDDLLVDDHALAVEHLMRGRGAVHFVHDNTGTELAMDLALADALLDGVTDSVVLHLKLHPTFVSDATLDDVLVFLDALESGQHGDPARGLGERLREAFVTGRLRFAPDAYWNSSRFLWELPPRLAQLFTGSRLVIFKGDANYRRVVGDALWSPETPLSIVTSGFPAPLLALRTLKSDPIVGLPPGTAQQLEALDPAWRVNARRGVIQASWK
jgi:uncharacterized protein with ATP-grasp and redox domains